MELYVLSADDARDLRALSNSYQPNLNHEVQQLAVLRAKLREAVIVKPAALARSVVSMNSVVKVVDMRLREARTLKVVFPKDVDAVLDRVSVLTPLGAAMLGRSEGDIFECALPGRVVRFAIKEILYQPERDDERRSPPSSLEEV